MPRHAAPRSPSRRRVYWLGGISVLGLAVTVAFGVLIAPNPTHPLALQWPEPATTSPAPRSSVPSASASARLSDIQVALQADRSSVAEASARQAEQYAALAVIREAQAAQESQAEQDAAEEAARQQAEQAAAQASKAAEREAAEAARQEAAAKPPPPAPVTETPRPASATTAAPSMSSGVDALKDYTLQLLGGDTSELAALEKLWGRESGWDPDAQNPSSTAYGIAQFLDSTWAATGFEKTSDPYIQIQAGLAYIEARYGSPSAAWAHSQATGWY